MPTKTLSQVVSYISSDLRRFIEKEVSRAKPRTTISSYIESVLRQHFEQKKGA